MSMISEQIENLRRIAKEWNPDTPINPVSVTLNQAADTIEALSAKLPAANTERSAEDCGKWIPCKNKPQRKRDESSRPVLVRYKDETANPDVCDYNFLTGKFVFIEKDVTKYVKEWREIPGYEP